MSLKDWKPSMLNGHPPNITDDCRKVLIRASKAGLRCTSTTDGGHASTSYHYSGRAVDVADALTPEGIQNMKNFQKAEFERGLKAGYKELFGPLNDKCIKNGAALTLAEGTALENQHDNHVHLAP